MSETGPADLSQQTGGEKPPFHLVVAQAMAEFAAVHFIQALTSEPSGSLPSSRFVDDETFREIVAQQELNQ